MEYGSRSMLPTDFNALSFQIVRSPFAVRMVDFALNGSRVLTALNLLLCALLVAEI